MNFVKNLLVSTKNGDRKMWISVVVKKVWMSWGKKSWILWKFTALDKKLKLDFFYECKIKNNNKAAKWEEILKIV